ncbi:mitochondrial genome maintenance exonuclease 1 [Elysia marginata]|uniref:Mitochondrial genome maintenance exonuclease 1 n=1 Tax=Elysia marginata TaxID=1093978 RepID=A0AAV4JRI4_9GAST|nr:mitochondrial genome maintenance exonuclease 1 [Elysia marginata]
MDKAYCVVTLTRITPPLNKRSSLRKKQYDYDLDSLVHWKRETKLLFGPQRKLTKSGKQKKRGIEPDKQCLENLDTLSSISLSNKDEDYSSEQLSENLSSKNLSERHLPESKTFISGDAVFLDHEKDSLGKGGPKRKNVKLKTGKRVKTTYNVPETQTDVEPGFISFNPLDIPSSSETRGQKSFNSTSESLDALNTHEVNEEHDEIAIPKLEPVPAGNGNVLLKKSLRPAVANLPIEAPASFEMVTSFPFTPPRISDDQKTTQFKMDVEKMALRVLPSVKTVLNKTMPELNRFFLNRWRETMVNELGEEGFQKYKNETMRQGINLHANIMEFLSGRPEQELQIMPENEGHWASLHSALQDLLCVIDWKVSKKPRPLLKNTYDDPLQVAAYAGAINATTQAVKEHGEINHGLIVVVYPDGSPAHTHLMGRAQMEQYWLEWTTRLHSFYMLTYTEKHAHKHQAHLDSKI